MTYIIKVYKATDNSYLGDVNISGKYTLDQIENKIFIYDFIPKMGDNNIEDGNFKKNNIEKEELVNENVSGLNGNKEEALFYKKVWVNGYSLKKRDNLKYEYIDLEK